ncbi:MAG TPA: APC family permease [Actinomycetota bacterium]|nr:APC family permease [Actinomycetota bacterium]
MAEAAIEERQLLKSLHWYDGFVIALCNPGFLIGSLGFSLLTIGVWGSVILWGISATVGLLQNWVYSESAAMFPDKPGGIALYAHEGWRSRFNLFGPVAAFGYWIGWSVVLSIFGNLIGGLVTAEWFSSAKVGGASPSEDGGYFDLGPVDIGLPHLIGIGVVIAVWLFNIYGVKPSLFLGYVTGALLMIPLAIFIVVPYLTGDWESSKVTYESVPGFSDFSVALMWLFIMCWSAYGIEVCASFAPEYHDTKRDTAIALRTAATFSLLVYVLLPLGLGGVVGTAGDAGPYYVEAFKSIAGSGLGGLALIFLIASLVLSMNSATADGGRALYGIARDDMTIKWLYHLNRFHVPARAMTVDMAVNALLILFIANNLAILYLSNIGYVLAHVLALTGFLLLRKDRPNWPRPIRVGPAWVGVAAVLAAFNLILIFWGVTQQDVAAAIGGYEFTGTPFYLGVGVLAASVLLFFYRRAVQDKAKITFRDTDVPTMPTEQQMALLREETMSS